MSALDAREQLMLELINRARMDPAGEAARFGINLNAGLSAGTISSAAKQVLAGNSFLEASAAAHSLDMINRDYFSHTGTGGTNAGARMSSKGYAAVGTFGWGENIAWSGSTGSYDANSQVYAQHKNLFLSSGHRENILRSNFEEIGIGQATGNFTGYNAMMTTQNFAYDTASDVHITGVHYTDSINDDFYSIGEGVGGRSVQVIKNGVAIGSTSTSAAGGYAVEVNTTGTVEVVFKGGGLPNDRGAQITLGSVNVKMDLVDGSTIETNASATLTRGSVHMKLLGIENINATGNAANNMLIGNKGANSLMGLGGNDTLIGNGGNDQIEGGAGNDVLYGSFGNDMFRFTTLLTGDDKIMDFVDGVDKLMFAKSVADQVSDFAISGNGTNCVTVTHGDDSVIVKGAAAIFLSTADFLFV